MDPTSPAGRKFTTWGVPWLIVLVLAAELLLLGDVLEYRRGAGVLE
jgi:hypothetical protein